ncbi:helix-turn-helix domain-containing protein [Lujinxingia vulgaris]|uniref:Helix-turn-helix domain-containing protein n=1 Tax=Lujinxingia vulgaris TaxID=2600176 RepID=A0A5C6X3P1_9DELT|nr:helix-turn-helix domain-containing protein [Lujinxingia vulgaris]TXD34906.1 helix-turn-helix domain-containing protein [Lujinxingia vulgaris]
MARQLDGKQWRRVAQLWNEVHALSGESLEAAWQHANDRLVELVGGVSMGGYAKRRSASGDEVGSAYFSGSGCDLDERLNILRTWFAREDEADVRNDPLTVHLGARKEGCWAVPHRACMTPEQWRSAPTRRLADAMGVGDAITVMVLDFQGAELSFCIDGAMDKRFDYSDAAVLEVASQGLRPLMLRYLRALGMLAGQRPLTFEERELVRLLASDQDDDVIARQLEVSPGALERMSARVYRKLGVANRYALIRLWYGVGESPISEEVATWSHAAPEPTHLTEEALVVARVRRVLAEVLGTPQMHLGDVARRLSMSERNLQRHLRRMGASFRGLLDEVRREQTWEMLNDPSLDFGEIAERLGYEQVSSFNRAVKRWTGKTPGELRNAQLPAADKGDVAAE